MTRFSEKDLGYRAIRESTACECGQPAPFGICPKCGQLYEITVLVEKTLSPGKRMFGRIADVPAFDGVPPQE